MEMAIHHALNGFEVILIDLYSFGLSYGVRGSAWTVFDMHENIGAMLKFARTDIPLFIYAHSMGCMVTQTFLIKNKSNPDLKNLAGVIFNAPYFGYPPMAEVGLVKKVLIKLLGGNKQLDVSVSLCLQLCRT